jgi:deoxyadenosine/deoxycytidine kinase
MNIPRRYLEALNQLYEDWIKTYTLAKVIIPCDEVDFVANSQDLEFVFNLLESKGLEAKVL